MGGEDGGGLLWEGLYDFLSFEIWVAVNGWMNEWGVVLMLQKSTVDLFERRHYLDRDLRARLAFREFGTCLGLQCMAAQASDKDRAVELKAYADRIVECWDPYIWMETGRNATPEELRPITRVMYAAALIPGGEWSESFAKHYLVLTFDSVLSGLFRA